MKHFEIEQLHNCELYPYVVFSTSYVSPLEEIDEIEEDLREKYKGKVLFDLLLSNGNSSNRYMEADFDGCEFDFKSFKVISQVDNTVKENIGKFYSEKIDISNGILSNATQFLIKKGKF